MLRMAKRVLGCVEDQKSCSEVGLAAAVSRRVEGKQEREQERMRVRTSWG